MPNRDDNPTQATDQRVAARFLRKESVSIQILLPCEDGSCPAEVVSSETLDLSMSGMRLMLPHPLKADRIFDICVELTDHPKRFLLTGETRWCRYNRERDAHEVGIEILNGEDTDFAAWSRFFEQGD